MSHALAFRTVAFSGRGSVHAAWFLLALLVVLCLGFCPATSDVFVLTNANGLVGLRDWIQLDTTGGPPPERFSPVVGYDSVSNRLIVSGGLGPVDPNTNTAFRTDTWVLRQRGGRYPCMDPD